MKTSNKPFVSIIIPVKNAEKFITKCLKSLNNLNYPRDRYEVIILDSNSSDRTRALAAEMGAKVIAVEGESVCAGRNSGFKASKGEIIAFSDADCVMDKDWISNAVKHLSRATVSCVGGPSLVPEDETAFGKACGFIFSFNIFTGGSPYGRYFRDVREVKHNPGCNAIYKRSVLEKVMPVSESFVEGEDVIMNKKLNDLGCKFLYTPDTKLWHYRSSNPKRFFRQNYKYAIGRVLLGRASRELWNPLHLLAGFSLPLIALSLVASSIISSTLFLSLIFSGFLFLLFFSLLGLAGTKSLVAALNVPYAIFLLMTGWSLGFIKEFFVPAKRKI